MDFSRTTPSGNSLDYLKDSSILQTEKQTQETVKKKRLSDMTDTEKKAHYDDEIARLEEKLKSVKEKRDKIGNVTDKQRNHALILFGSHFITQEQLYKWYQLPPKERDKAIRDYALSLKSKLEGV